MKQQLRSKSLRLKLQIPQKQQYPVILLRLPKQSLPKLLQNPKPLKQLLAKQPRLLKQSPRLKPQIPQKQQYPAIRLQLLKKSPRLKPQLP